MDNFYGGFAILLIGTKSFYYTLLAGYLASIAYGLSATAFAKAPFVGYDETSPLFGCIAFSESLKTDTVWMLITNAVAFVSFLMFWFGNKGEVCSVAGSLLFVINFLQMIVLFVMV